MKRIRKFNLSNLRNEEHFGFMSIVCSFIVKITPQLLGIGSLFGKFMAALKLEEEALERVKGNAKTEQLITLDKKRNSIERGFELLVDTYVCCNYDETLCQHAKNVRVVLKHYKGIRRKNYTQKSSSIYNLIQDLRQRCENDLEAIPEAKGWLEELQLVNNTFINIMGDRFDDEAAEMEVELKKVRQEVDHAYTLIVDAINVFVTVNGEDDYVEFIKAMKPRIDYCVNLIAQRQGRNKAKKRKEEEEAKQLETE